MLLSLLAIPAVAGAAALTEGQKQAIRTICQTYKDMGQADRAAELVADVRAGRCLFGPTSGGNAAYDWKGHILLNPEMDKVINNIPDPVERNAMRYGVALSIVHEKEHSRQNSFLWGVDSMMEWSGLGNRCEQRAWGYTFLVNYGWIQRQLEAFRKAPEGSPQRVLLARRLRGLARVFLETVGDYDSLKGQNGTVTFLTRQGTRRSPEDLARGIGRLDAELKAYLARHELRVDLPGEIQPTPTGFTLKATVRGGVPPYRYAWKWWGQSKVLGRGPSLAASASSEAILAVTVTDADEATVQAKCRVKPQAPSTSLPLSFKEVTYTDPHSGTTYRSLQLRLGVPARVASSYRVKVRWAEVFSGRQVSEEFDSLTASQVESLALSNPKPGSVLVQVWEHGSSRYGELRW